MGSSTTSLSAAEPFRRVGVIGDLHAEDAHLRIALETFRRERVDAVLAVGDIADGEGSVVECCRLLQSAGALCVRGNHDRWILAGEMRNVPHATLLADLDAETRAFLASLPATRRFETILGPLLLCHGMGDDDMGSVGEDDVGYALETNDALQRLLREDDIAIVVSGHRHRPMVRAIDGLTLIRPGTLKRDDGPRFAVLDLEARKMRLYELSSDGRVTPGVELALAYRRSRPPVGPSTELYRPSRDR